MSPELTLYYQHKSLASIGKSLSMATGAVAERLRRERRLLKLSPRGRAATNVSEEMSEFIEDKKLIIELASGGMLFKEIADKWDVAEITVRRYLSKWGMIVDVVKEVDSINLSELYTGWADIPQGRELILTINKKPMFKLVRIL